MDSVRLLMRAKSKYSNNSLNYSKYRCLRLRIGHCSVESVIVHAFTRQLGHSRRLRFGSISITLIPWHQPCWIGGGWPPAWRC